MKSHKGSFASITGQKRFPLQLSLTSTKRKNNCRSLNIVYVIIFQQSHQSAHNQAIIVNSFQKFTLFILSSTFRIDTSLTPCSSCCWVYQYLFHFSKAM